MERSNRAGSIVMAHDPSICAWGYSVLKLGNQTVEVLEVGCIKTGAESKKRRIRKGDDTVRRINEINTQLLEVIRRRGVTYMVSEQPHGSQSAVAAVMIGNVVGMLQTMSDCLDIGVEWYSEGDAKNNLLHKRSASKDEVIAAIAQRYEVPWTYVGFRDEAIADSLAVFHVARSQSAMIKNFLNR